jgi:DNA polymerase-3 subunit gamma/tau
MRPLFCFLSRPCRSLCLLSRLDTLCLLALSAGLLAFRPTLAIARGNHPDVLEFDAASHTGVDDVRTLFEGVAYAPVQGKYKVYIVDEVHMLSKQAFNALLKTLEEPPPNVVFVFATTEVHKIPITVLSRCQRFDLKRVPQATLLEHFLSILTKENITAEPAAVQLISRAADGSVRDGLSLLDQAIALAMGKGISAESVMNMLGLSDRTQVWALLENIVHGNSAEALKMVDDMVAKGQDSLMLVQDLMALTHLLTRLKLVPALAQGVEVSELEKQRGVPLAEKMPLENLSRLYQMLLTAAGEIKTATHPADALSMALVRVAHLCALPPLASLVEQMQVGQTIAPVLSAVNAAPKPAPADLKETDEMKNLLAMFPGAEVVSVKSST